MRKQLCALSLMLILSACTSTPKDADQAEPVKTPSERPISLSPSQMLSRLGMVRDLEQLGFQEQGFNPCQFGGGHPGSCDQQYVSIVHFQLLCRESEGTIQEIPQLFPITSANIEWKVAGQSGGTSTNEEGYGRVSLISRRPVRGLRLTLKRGAQFVAFTISEIGKVVLPSSWCASGG